MSGNLVPKSSLSVSSHGFFSAGAKREGGECAASLLARVPSREGIMALAGLDLEEVTPGGPPLLANTLQGNLFQEVLEGSLVQEPRAEASGHSGCREF